jgi:serine/threonine-protein kinase RsbW
VIATAEFPAVRASVAAARRFTTGALAGIAPETLETAELLVSELATNCIRHVGTGFELTIRSSAKQVRVEVTDHGGGEPEMRNPKPTDVSGRGLRIVDMLSERWGVEHAAGAGKTVWFTLALGGATRAAASARSRDHVAGARRSRPESSPRDPSGGVAGFACRSRARFAEQESGDRARCCGVWVQRRVAAVV